MKNKKSTQLANNVKPTVLNSFGEIASAISDYFVNNLGDVMTLLKGASQTTVDTDDEDQVDYLIALRESILETYTMIIQALQDNSLNAIAPYVNDILAFINVIWMDKDNLNDTLISSIIGIIGYFLSLSLFFFYYLIIQLYLLLLFIICFYYLNSITKITDN